MSSPRTVPALIRHAASAFGEQVAIADGDIALTYQELDVARLQAARAFVAAGINKGDRVAIWAPNLYEWIICAIGLQTLGGVMVPLNTRLKGAEAAYILERSGARLLFTVTDFLGINYPDLLKDQHLPALENIVLFRGQHAKAQGWNAFLASGNAVPESAVLAMEATVTPDDTMDLLFTSGTTGKPKGVMCGHGQNIEVFEVWARAVGLTSDDNYLIINPFFHSFGFKAGWLACFIAGARVLPVASFDLDEVLATIERDRVSVLPGPPTIYQSLLAHPKRGEYDLSSLKLAVTGAAAVPVELVQRMRSDLGFGTVITAYGLTETCGMVSICQRDDDPQTIATTSGRAIPGVEVRCVDGAGNEVARGEAGEIVVRGYNVMQGYFDNPEATAEAIDADGWLHTGDIGVMDGRGYLRITDRMKDMFIVGGFNCYPAEIEGALSTMKGVAQVAVIGIPDERMGEVAKAYIVKAPGAALDQAAVIAWSREHMANYKVPRQVAFLEAMPLNASGKVLKTRLREMHAEG
ncbi:MAG TPA: FadD3 family acyl-CoA ligase [Pseudomonadales bacterium]